MNVCVMKDYKLELRNLHSSDALEEARVKDQMRFLGTVIALWFSLSIDKARGKDKTYIRVSV
jgi:hypothetical protein